MTNLLQDQLICSHRSLVSKALDQHKLLEVVKVELGW
jgi:hypothetical protein